MAAASQWCIPSLAMFAGQINGLTAPRIWLLAGLGLAIGMRWMAIHQYQDIVADERAGIATIATRGGPVFAIVAGAFVSELILIAATLGLVWPDSQGAILALGIWFSHALFTLHERPALAESLLSYADAPLASYYFLLLPLALAVSRMSSMSGAYLATILFAMLGYGHARKFWGEMADVICRARS